MFRIFKVIKEISLYKEYVRTIRAEEGLSPIWRAKNLRIDKINRIYTVINLPLEVLLATDLPKESRPSFVINEVKPINTYLQSLNLEELITMGIEPVAGTNEEAYLVVYQFLFRHISVLWILRFIAEIAAIVTIIVKWNSIISLF
jgi:hypothetical protein